ncbi:Methyltransferase domain-containing protein [Collimonas sp. OK607]|uniref:class I SAM-dependent methyltransferase n=1 Tax=Collimonas sp. OK607 TaxID=1798194 RepID=UPI0008E461E7|nr:class I SAM-dependent methyltransferase [Collimonas sp. OK607]SFB34251.1 Methyltransferase domain-containing protein [Collimonas sp. OK607]
MSANYLPKVRDQYESLPYPPCNPQDEKKQLTRTWLESLAMINHYCFSGKQSFKEHFRVLVAGGGTGDATIYLAEQLRNTDAEIVHLDLSLASIALARERADIRGLKNITWVQDSLLNLPELGLGKFDYINCSGVLHHLENPDAGLKKLRAVLKDTGAMGLMVYATHGRTGIYQMQQLMRLVNNDNGDEFDADTKIGNTKEILNTLPASNWFMRGEDLHHDHKLGDAGIYDLLLHSQDRAYTVGELFDWIQDTHGLNLELTDVGRGRSPYLPHMVLGKKPPKNVDTLKKQSIRRQYEIGELLIGDIITHSFYVTRSETCKAPYGDADYVPFFYHEPLTGPLMAQVFDTNKGRPFALNHQHSGMALTVNPGKYGAKILRHIDGKNSFQQIFDTIRKEPEFSHSAPSNQDFFADFRESFDTLNALERLLLRHVSTDGIS